VPFCGRRCFYCDFATEAMAREAAVRRARMDAYLAALHHEIDASDRRPACTVFFGGGTPTQLDAAELLGIVDHVRSHGGILGEAEVTVEANPTTAEADKFRRLREGGVNRLSLGIQSFDDELLLRLGRTHSAGEAVSAYRLAREVGFDNLSLDLMFNLPGQSLDDWRRALEQAIALQPEHLSLYSLTVEEGTPLARYVETGRVVLPDEETDATMFELAMDTLPAAGYEHYEISNFAQPGRRSRHNQVYWRNEAYRGYGPGAASYAERVRWLNAGKLEDYVARSEAGTDLADDRETRDVEGEQRETMFLGLRMIDGVDSAWFAARYGARPEELFGPELGRLAADGLVTGDGGRWRLTRRGVMLANQVFMEFV
jgi:oxygen-independent coproporphyrinogen-3 oxidase